MEYTQLEKLFMQTKELIKTPDLWVQHTLQEGQKFCMEGALVKIIKTVSSNNYEQRMAFCICIDLLCDLLTWPYPELYKWNDRPERTHAEVMAAFDLAIAYCQAHQEKIIQLEVQQAEMENKNVSLV